MKNQHTISLFSLLGLLALTSCTAADSQPSPMMPVMQPMAYQEPAPGYSNPGSMFQDGDARYLFADSRARRVGDIVMVKIVESSTASSSATTNTKKENTTEYGVGSFLGQTQPFFPVGAVGDANLLSTNTTKDFQGSGDTSRKNNVSASIAARVISVMPDGLMQIEGVRETRVNNETQYLVVSGLVRSRDIAADNSILSSQIANAQMAYYGKGVISDKQKPGWFNRLMDTVWPF